MSEKRKDDRNRWRNKLVGIRMSPEEATQLDKMVQLSGYSKQDYIISKLLDHTVLVQGNPRVYKALRDALAEVLDELQNCETPTPDIVVLIAHIVNLLEGLGREQKDDS